MENSGTIRELSSDSSGLGGGVDSSDPDSEFRKKLIAQGLIQGHVHRSCSDSERLILPGVGDLSPQAGTGH